MGTTPSPQCTNSNQDLDGQRLTFAGLNALEPCVLKIWADLNRTVVEPSTAAEAATEFASIADAAPGTPAG